MGKSCCVCGISTIFYIWTSSRNFPREKLAYVLKLGTVQRKKLVESKEPNTVCTKCYNKMITNEEI